MNTTPIFKQVRERQRKVKVKDLTASEIRKVALNILKYEYNAEVWPQNNLAVRGRKFIGRKGVSDILGFSLDNGRMVMAEIKTNSDVLSEDQRKLLQQLNDCGGIALIAYQEGIHVRVTTFIQYIAKAA